MQCDVILLVSIILVNISPIASSYFPGHGASSTLTEGHPLHPRHGRVDNPHVIPDYDCALRAFTIEMVNYIAPPEHKHNWTILAQSAFQMNQCPHISHTDYQPPTHSPPFNAPPTVKKPSCHHSIFVHDATGDDLADGTLTQPMKTTHAALHRSRTRRAVYGSEATLCIIIRGGTYYLGTNATDTSSQRGALALTSNDSNIVIESYESERVVLSGGVRLDLKWSVHSTKTRAGGTIMKAQVPWWVNVDEFNELYIDDRRAVIAKYPNGDPSTEGLYASTPGFSYASQSWISPVRRPSVDIHVQEPHRDGTTFPYYQLGLGGGASVFDPPANFWSTASPPAGDNYVVPRGVTVKSDALPHMHQWSNSSTGFVHAFHSGYWGSWIFQIASSNATQNTITFGRGGFQEARGSDSGGAFYVSNIFEELDSPNEWFLDKITRTLYFMPNDTMPNTFVASQIPCLISLTGGSSNSIDDVVRNVTIRGLVLTQTSATYMREYMVPSGGDWAVHRGGTVYLSNTKDVTITQNVFTQLGSNGVAVIDYNEGTRIVSNEFVWLADSAVVLVGSTNGIDGYSVASQPTNTLIQSNLMHETGIYVKQSSPVLISVSRSVSVVGNVMFNMPRAAVNINDGFYGNHTVSWNVIFNTVRETSDHGPINSWDRQPYLTDAVQAGLPSVWQHESYIHHNVLFNNYNSFYPIDHDDGSCFYEDSYNFQVYGGKKNYLGHSKTDHHEIYVYPDTKSSQGTGVCIADQAPSRGSSGWNEVWTENTCILYQSPVPYNIWSCNTADLFVPYLANNRIYIPGSSQVAFTCNVIGSSARLSLDQWQAYGLDIGTTVQQAPDIQTIIQWGREMLQPTK